MAPIYLPLNIGHLRLNLNSIDYTVFYDTIQQFTIWKRETFVSKFSAHEKVFREILQILKK